MKDFVPEVVGLRAHAPAGTVLSRYSNACCRWEAISRHLWTDRCTTTCCRVERRGGVANTAPREVFRCRFAGRWCPAVLAHADDCVGLRSSSRLVAQPTLSWVTRGSEEDAANARPMTFLPANILLKPSLPPRSLPSLFLLSPFCPISRLITLVLRLPVVSDSGIMIPRHGAIRPIPTNMSARGVKDQAVGGLDVDYFGPQSA